MSKPILGRQFRGAYKRQIVEVEGMKVYYGNLIQIEREREFRTSLLIDFYRGSISKVL